MIKSITIKDIALIDVLQIDFYQGLNVLTGETGAGKSIILGALQLILGEKASQDYIREGADKGRVEVVFDITNNTTLKEILDSMGLPAEDELIITRELSRDGKSRCFANLAAIPVAALKSIGESLVDISGQHQHESLLRQKNHLHYLDDFASLHKELEDFALLYENYLQIKSQYDDLLSKEQEKERNLEFARFAVNEIETAQLSIGEDEELDNELKYLENYQKLSEHIEFLYETLYERDPSIITMLEEVIPNLENASNIETSLKDAVTDTNEALYKLEGVKDSVRSIREGMEYSPERHQEVIERLELIKNLKKKYGKTIPDIFESLKHNQESINILESSEQQKEELKKQLEQIQSSISQEALSLSKKRQDKAKALQEEVEKELSFLGMDKARFVIDFKYVHSPDSFIKVGDKGVRLEETGIDRVEFMFSANVGESPQPLGKIASGGELSRVMLAIKTILTGAEPINSLVFDEVDVGISGEIANKVGKKIKEISKFKQVLCITHSPPIASLGNHNYLVTKTIKDGRTVSHITQLSKEEKVREIARMLGGEHISDTTLQHAAELIKKGE